ncbi:MAG: response regulator [Halieaceae bacterium]
MVEDVDAMRMYLRLALEGHGFEVTEAADLEQARACLRSGASFTSILLDLELPDGHGLDLIPELPAHVPVAVMSADDSPETELRCQQAGCTAILRKNEKFRELGKVIAEIEKSPRRDSTLSTGELELAGDYLVYLTESRIELQHAANCHDFESVRRISHRLRGTAVHFGYNGISKGAKNVGLAIASGKTNEMHNSVDILIDSILQAVGRHRFQ